jgi:hypothetical protein
MLPPYWGISESTRVTPAPSSINPTSEKPRLRSRASDRIFKLHQRSNFLRGWRCAIQRCRITFATCPIIRFLFDKVRLKSDSGVICVEMIKKFQMAGFRVAEVPVHHYFRAYGKSQFFNFQRIFAVGLNLIELWYELVVRKDTQELK